jgi:glyoxylase-like metal-dependent hydrolase (beta-lactamase superfamily II)
MNPLESQLAYPFGDDLPETGKAMDITPGIRWLRMPLPFALNHVNLWLLEDEIGGQRGWTAIDCGIDNETTRAAWDNIAGHHLQGLPVLRVIATHFHPDHLGAADWLCARWEAPLWMTTGEYMLARVNSAALQGADGEAMVAHFRRHGVTDEGIARIEERRSYYPRLVPVIPSTYVRLQDRQAVRIGAHDWEVITGFGHSPEHASLYCKTLGLLISGDMVLPRISTNVSVFSMEPEANPVQAYLESLQKLASLPDQSLVLPSHGKPFYGLHTRIRQLQDHHAARLAEVREACATPQSAADILPVMFPRALDAHQLTFALGEAIAHLHQLWLSGELVREQGDDQVFRFRRGPLQA